MEPECSLPCLKESFTDTFPGSDEPSSYHPILLSKNYCIANMQKWTVSSETASRPNKRFNENLSLDKPLHVIYKVNKLAYRIWVILIANRKSYKKYP
jgi:hypothetical protein